VQEQVEKLDGEDSKALMRELCSRFPHEMKHILENRQPGSAVQKPGFCICGKCAMMEKKR